MKKKTILFFPVEIGLAHIITSLAVAQKLKNQGHRVVFALNPKKSTLIRQAGFEVKPLSLFLEDEIVQSVERLKNKQAMKNLVQEELEVIKIVKADAIVVSLRFSAAAAGAIANIPTYFLINSSGLPCDFHVPNPGYPKAVHKIIKTIAQKAVRRVKNSFITTLVDVAHDFGWEGGQIEFLKRMFYLVPEPPGYMPAAVDSLHLKYIGPLFWDGFRDYHPPWLTKIHPDGKTVYVSFGGTGFDGKKLVELAIALNSAGYRVIVSTGNIIDPSSFPKRENLFVEHFIPGHEMCQRVDVVVCHGGYGTMMQAVMSGKPVVSLPFNADQVLEAYRFQELGLGKCLLNISPTQLVPFDWKKLMWLGSGVKVASIIDAVRLVLNKRESYNLAIERFRRTLPRKSSSDTAADVIINNLNT